jgi:NADH dehydrogenase (ubiquinone) 1 alpha subcomplex subunit 9
MRPSYMFGQSDSFLFYFRSKYRTHRLPGFVIVPMYKGGTTSIKQPVHVQDVGKAIVNAIQNPDARGQTYQAVGPHRYRMADLVRWMYLHMRYVPNQNFGILPFVDPILIMRNKFNNFIRPATSLVGPHHLEFECHTDVVSAELPTLEDLGITLTPLEDRIAWELRHLRRHNFYMESIGEYPTPPNPPLATS